MYKELIQQLETAKNEVRVADHMLIMTYPLVRDPKMLIAILKKLMKACDIALNVAVKLEYENKKITVLPKDIGSKIKIIGDALHKSYGFERMEIRIIKEIYKIMQEHEAAAIEFTRKEKLIISSEDYHLRTLSYNQIKKYVPLIKSFISKIEKRVKLYERWKSKALG